MQRPSRTLQFGVTVLILLLAAAFVLWLGWLVYVFVYALVLIGLDSNGEPVQSTVAEPLLPSWFFPRCAHSVPSCR